MPDVDYTGVTSFIDMLRKAKWTRINPEIEYLWITMMPELESHLPEGTTVVGWGDAEPGGLANVTLQREVRR